MKGFFTPTEAGAVGAFTVALVAVVKRDINLKGIIKSMGESLVTTSMVILLILGSTIFGHFITVTKIPLFVGDWILSLPLHPSIVVILIGFVYLVGGSFIDDLAFMILATPIFYPVIVRLGYDLIWFGIFLQIVVMIGIIIPPMAVSIFVVQNITQVPIWTIYSGVFPFLISFAFCVFLLILFPQIVLFLPSLFAP